MLYTASVPTARVNLNDCDCIFKGGKRSVNTTHTNTTRERDSIVPLPRAGGVSSKGRDSSSKGSKDKINVLNVRVLEEIRGLMRFRFSNQSLNSNVRKLSLEGPRLTVLATKFRETFGTLPVSMTMTKSALLTNLTSKSS